MFMGKRLYEEVDEKTFDYIKRCKDENGFVDCNKLFKNLHGSCWKITSFTSVVTTQS